jgi:hypothetical protein
MTFKVHGDMLHHFFKGHGDLKKDQGLKSLLSYYRSTFTILATNCQILI